MSWENYGDVNPIEHGGIFVKADEDFPKSFYIVEVVPVFDSEETWQISDLYVDVDNDWDWDSIYSYADLNDDSDDVWKAIALAQYYGYIEFGSAKMVDSESEVINELKEFGIELK